MKTNEMTSVINYEVPMRGCIALSQYVRRNNEYREMVQSYIDFDWSNVEPNELAILVENQKNSTLDFDAEYVFTKNVLEFLCIQHSVQTSPIDTVKITCGAIKNVETITTRKSWLKR